MEKLFEQLKVYLKMDTEISFEEFASYYQQVIDFLKENYDRLDQDGLLKARYITSIIQSNALDRARRKGVHAKKYKKMAEKCNLWAGAANYKLLQSGMTQEEIDRMDKEISDSI
ncbi:hypothetical protein [Zhaonella formicivorans]|uniref:hypothetical protein n=1 Tax=Zhaonella formicivorans TaxID=2528593 RepID=UPI0010D58182|nr:hypothetical protein [Zhaonella formicivorans]